MQTILGAGGTIGSILAKELTPFTNEIRLVSRNPKKVNDSDLLFPADLSDPIQVDAAIAGSDVVYVVIGFPYDIKVWRKVWPAFMHSVIDACIKYKSKLVFFDNVYMYDPAFISNMTEDSPMQPSSKKGKVRLQLVNMIFDAVKNNSLKALIARAGDFYGPGNERSVLVETVPKNFLKGKKADYFVSAKYIHTYTFTPDAAKATALLGNTDDAFDQVWHLPTTNQKLTGEQWIALFAKEMHAKNAYRTLPVWMMKILGLFVPVMKEFPEMMYQYDRDYVFISDKFEKRFGIAATSPEEGVHQTVEALKK